MFFLAIIITGGEDGKTENYGRSRSVEVLREDGSLWCLLNSLPEGRTLHTQSGFVTCGGSPADISGNCVSFSDAVLILFICDQIGQIMNLNTYDQNMTIFLEANVEI